MSILGKNPWVLYNKWAKYRCTNKNSPNYHRYGGRGIKFKLSIDDVKKLWLRDEAYNLDIPVLDRRNNNGNYCYSNCQFIERNLNSKKEHIKHRLNTINELLWYLQLLKGDMPIDDFIFNYKDIMTALDWKYDKIKKWVRCLLELKKIKVINKSKCGRGVKVFYKLNSTSNLYIGS